MPPTEEELKQVLINLPGTFDFQLLRKIEDAMPNLSRRAFNALNNDKILYMGELVQKTQAQLSTTPNLGALSVAEIEGYLEKDMKDVHTGMVLDYWPPPRLDDLSAYYEKLLQDYGKTPVIRLHENELFKIIELRRAKHDLSAHQPDKLLLAAIWVTCAAEQLRRDDPAAYDLILRTGRRLMGGNQILASQWPAVKEVLAEITAYLIGLNL